MDLGHAEDEPASFACLPNECLIAIVEHLDTSSLLHAARINHLLASIAQRQIFRHPSFRSIAAFDKFLCVLERDSGIRKKPTGDASIEEDLKRCLEDRGLAKWVQTVQLRLVMATGSAPLKGSTHLARLRICQNMRELAISGLDDFRVKHLDGHGSLRNLAITNTSFRALSRPASPHLHRTLQNVTTLTLSNLGLPSEDAFVSLVMAASRSLEHLHLSAVRDVGAAAFASAFAGLFTPQGSCLKNVRLRNLTTSQSNILPSILRQLTAPHVEFTTPLPHLEHLEGLSPSVKKVTLLRRAEEDFEIQETVEDEVMRFVRGQRGGEGWEKLRVWKDLAVQIRREKSTSFDRRFQVIEC